MTLENYVERQKSIIRERHVGEESYFVGGQEIPIKTREQFLSELDGLKGLNKRERAGKSFPSRRAMRA